MAVHSRHRFFNLLLHGLFTASVIAVMSACTKPAPSSETANQPTTQPAAIELTENEQSLVEELDALGYLGGSEDLTQLSGVVHHDASKAQPGFNLYIANHEASASLVDMDGNLLHKWSHNISKLARKGRTLDVWRAAAWGRAHLFPNGDLLAVHNSFGMIKLDKDSKLLWEFEGLAHHDLEVLDDGTIYVLTFEKSIIPRINATKVSREDFIAVLDANGTFIRKVSLLECVERSGIEQLMMNLPIYGDLLHTNTLQVLDGSLANRIPEFRRGNVLVSFLTLSTIAVIDMDAQKIVWTLNGDFQFQHRPTALENGHILVFDNLGLRTRAAGAIRQARGEPRNLWHKFIFSKIDNRVHTSRVLEIDPVTKETVWQYPGVGQKPFFSSSAGSALRLGNGNTLITESQFGRAFEVTPQGETVWEFHGPSTLFKPGKKAMLFDVERLRADFPIDWASGLSESK